MKFITQHTTRGNISKGQGALQIISHTPPIENSKYFMSFWLDTFLSIIVVFSALFILWPQQYFKKTARAAIRLLRLLAIGYSLAYILRAGISLFLSTEPIDLWKFLIFTLSSVVMLIIIFALVDSRL